MYTAVPRCFIKDTVLTSIESEGEIGRRLPWLTKLQLFNLEVKTLLLWKQRTRQEVEIISGKSPPPAPLGVLF